jgi:hypothetical protein
VDLPYLKEFRSLYIVVLNDTDITDAGLVHLKELKPLNSLDLRGTKITASRVKEL